MNAQAVRSKQGFTLAAALLYVAVITAALASLTSLLLTEYRITKNAISLTQALYTAEAGIDLALHEFNREAQGAAAWAGWARSGASYRLDSAPEILRQESTLKPELSVVADTAALTVTATGRVAGSAGSPAVSRTVAVKLKRVGPTHAVQTWEER